MRHAELEELPRFIRPMLASSGSAPTASGWALEVKWDGIRAQLRYDGGCVCLRSRPGRDCTEQFPELVDIAGALAARRVILDGELVCLDLEGKPDFGALRRRLTKQPRRSPPTGRRATMMILTCCISMAGLRADCRMRPGESSSQASSSRGPFGARPATSLGERRACSLLPPSRVSRA